MLFLLGLVLMCVLLVSVHRLPSFPHGESMSVAQLAAERHREVLDGSNDGENEPAQHTHDCASVA